MVQMAYCRHMGGRIWGERSRMPEGSWPAGRRDSSVVVFGRISCAYSGKLRADRDGSGAFGGRTAPRSSPLGGSVSNWPSPSNSLSSRAFAGAGVVGRRREITPAQNRSQGPSRHHLAGHLDTSRPQRKTHLEFQSWNPRTAQGLQHRPRRSLLWGFPNFFEEALLPELRNGQWPGGLARRWRRTLMRSRVLCNHM